MLKKNTEENVYISIDDTDDMSKEISTGAIAEKIADKITDIYGAHLKDGITRHQLLLDRRIPYTSHNSAMCLQAWVPMGIQLAEIAWEIIEKYRASTSSPGLCVYAGAKQKDLIEFGKKAQREYIEIAEAKVFKLPGLILKGEGQGVVGALAGVGLRLSGNDGRFRGKWDMRVLGSDVQKVSECRDRFMEMGIDARFLDEKNRTIEADRSVILVSDAKPILYDDFFTIICEEKGDGSYLPYSKVNFISHKMACELFEPDPDIEEHTEDEELRSCGACLFRRLTNDGILCKLK